MYDQRVTIAEAVNKIQNQNYLLPAIQREIVWKRNQITDIFDSVLQGFPIGTFLYWDIEDEKRDDYTMYGFIKDYITNTKYINTTSQSRNTQVTPDGSGNLKLILDGQQRLSAFYIGLKGTYTYKQPYKWYKNKGAWKKSKLYFKITSNPSQELDDSGDRQTKYEFKFLPIEQYSDKIVKRGDDLWLRVGAILDYPDSLDIDDLKDNICNEYLDKDNNLKKYVGHNLRELRTAIHDKKYITYFEEKKQNIDRVLEVFIRTNDGGTELQKSDLLLSIATANWTKYDAREELTSFVDHLNTQLPKINNYDKDFLLKSTLVLTDLPVAYRVSQFNRDNVSKIEDEWLTIKNAIEEAAKLVNYYGIDENTLTSKNAVIPIAYYLKETGLTSEKLKRGEKEYFEIKQNIKKWLITSLLHKTFSGSADVVLRNIRKVLSKNSGRKFPIDEINNKLKSLNKLVGFDEEIAENFLEYKYGSKRTFLALSLLYPQNDWGSIQHHMDHIFPSSKVNIDDLVSVGYTHNEAEELTERANQLANLQLLTARENESKQDKTFEQWVNSQNSSFFDRHMIPSDQEYHKLENFDKFLDKREEKIKDKIISILG